jgi:hypothetical protein
MDEMSVRLDDGMDGRIKGKLQMDSGEGTGVLFQQCLVHVFGFKKKLLSFQRTVGPPPPRSFAFPTPVLYNT